MRAGKLRHRITLQSQFAIRDSFGGETVTWNDESTVWASVDPLSGREYFDSARVNAELSHRVRIRFFSTLTPGWRVLFGSRVLDVKSVINFEERGIYQDLMCQEVVSV